MTDAPRLIHVIFDGPPGHESGRFVEVEDDAGRSINFGEWRERPPYWELVFPAPTEAHDAAAVLAFLDTPAAARITGMMCFQFINYARLWRDTGDDLAASAEAEQSFFMLKMLRHAAASPDGWVDAFGAEVTERLERLALR